MVRDLWGSPTPEVDFATLEFHMGNSTELLEHVWFLLKYVYTFMCIISSVNAQGPCFDFESFFKLLHIHVYYGGLFKWVLIAFIVYLIMRGTCAFWYIHICEDVLNNISLFPYHHIPVILLLTRMILFPWNETTASYSHIFTLYGLIMYGFTQCYKNSEWNPVHVYMDWS